MPGVRCATGCNVSAEENKGALWRFKPRYNPHVNDYWICDEGRLSYKRYQGEGRLLQPVVREGDAWTVRTWDEVRRDVVARLREIALRQSADRIAGIISAQATNEEVFLFERLMREALSGRVAGLSWSPPDASHDDLLIDRDKNPNTAGLRALTTAGSSARVTTNRVRRMAIAFTRDRSS